MPLKRRHRNEETGFKSLSHQYFIRGQASLDISLYHFVEVEIPYLCVDYTKI
jgi:hypothetical protein